MRRGGEELSRPQAPRLIDPEGSPCGSLVRELGVVCKHPCVGSLPGSNPLVSSSFSENGCHQSSRPHVENLQPGSVEWPGKNGKTRPVAWVWDPESRMLRLNCSRRKNLHGCSNKCDNVSRSEGGIFYSKTSSRCQNKKTKKEYPVVNGRLLSLP